MVPDCLSRIPISALTVETDDCLLAPVTMGIDYAALAAAQRECLDIKAYRTAITDLELQDVQWGNGAFTLLCDVSQGHPRPIVPPSFRRQVFNNLHAVSHPGIRSSQVLVGQRFVWHGMRKDVAEWCRTCLACQAAKVHRHVHSPVEAIPVPSRHFSHVNVDIVGPLPASRGFHYLLTVMDRTTRWPEAIPLVGITAQECARAFIGDWVSRYGVPLEMTSDRGRQFTSSLWSAMAKALDCKLYHTTAFHPQGNGMVERAHRHMKDSLRARLSSPSWMDDLPWVLLGIRSTPKLDLGASPAAFVFRHSPLLPGDFVSPPAPTPLPLIPRFPQHHASPGKVDNRHTLSKATHVFVRIDGHRSPLQRPYTGPFPVLERGPKHFKIKFANGREDRVSVDRLKAARLPADYASDVSSPVPPRRQCRRRQRRRS